MSRRKRKEPTLTEKLAAALAMLLPAEQYKALHGDRLLELKPVSAETIIRLFTFDHTDLHSMGGDDTWANLTPRLRGLALKAKDRRDTSIAAKSKRIRRNAAAWVCLRLSDPPRGDTPKRKRTIPNRPFPKQTRKLRTRGFDRRSHANIRKTL